MFVIIHKSRPTQFVMLVESEKQTVLIPRLDQGTFHDLRLGL
jgi:hypothetical protein